MTFRKRNIVLLVGICVMVGMTISLPGATSPLTFHETSKVGSILLPILFMSLLLERSLDVFLTATRQADSQKLEREIQDLTAKIFDENGVLNDENSSELAVLTEKKERLAQRRFETRLLALWVSLYAGVLLGCIGFRTLGGLIPPESLAGLGPVRYAIFRVCDLLLTGGVIAGGGEGVHKLMEGYRGVIDGVVLARK